MFISTHTTPIQYTGLLGESDLLFSVVSSYGAMTGDTWSSELGVLSPSAPRMITRPWRTARTGTNGAVSVLGVAVAGLGGALLGLAGATGAMVTGGTAEGLGGLAGRLVVAGAVSGLFGSLLDSLLGATLQETRVDGQGRITEEGKGKVVKEGGWNVLDNHQVNFLASLLTTLVVTQVARSTM
jgi:uncharacterized membrane protein